MVKYAKRIIAAIITAALFLALLPMTAFADTVIEIPIVGSGEPSANSGTNWQYVEETSRWCLYLNSGKFAFTGYSLASTSRQTQGINKPIVVEIASGAELTAGSSEATISNSGTISGGTFSGDALLGEVENKGTISGGTFTGKVTNKGTISGGTFTGEVINDGGTSIMQKLTRRIIGSETVVVRIGIGADVGNYLIEGERYSVLGYTEKPIGLYLLKEGKPIVL